MSKASIIRQCKPGRLVKLVRHDWLKPGLPLQLGTVREIHKCTQTEITFKMPGPRPFGDSLTSHMRWPLASDLRATEKGFEVSLGVGGNFKKAMGYEFVNTPKEN